MRIAILANSFPPETGGAPGRIHRMALALRGAGHEVSVLCCMPNYPKGRIFPAYRGKMVAHEAIDGIEVTRLWLLPSNSQSLWRRGLSLLSYLSMLATAGRRALRKSKPDLVIISSPPLPMAWAAMRMARRLGVPALLNVSDIWPLSAREMGALHQGFAYGLLHRMEQYLYRHAAAWMGQSAEILAHIRQGSRLQKPALLYRNLQAAPVLNADRRATPLVAPGTDSDGAARPAGHSAPVVMPRRILYAGLLGPTQGVLTICKAIDFAYLGARLDVYGDGSERAALAELAADQPERGIRLHDTVSGAAFQQAVAGADAVLVPLRIPIHGAVPSKLFLAIAHGKPALFCGGGEGAALVAHHRLGWTSQPGDTAALAQNIRALCALDAAAYGSLCNRVITARNEVFDAAKQQAQFLNFIAQLAPDTTPF